jgi:O-antigen ligase
VLSALAELGLAGSIPFFALISVLVRRSYKLCASGNGDRESRCLSIGLFIGLIATLAHGLVEPTFPGREYSVIFWVYASLIFLWDPSRTTLGPIGVSERPAIRFDSMPASA